VPFTRNELDELLAIAELGVSQLVAAEDELLAEPPPPRRLILEQSSR